MEELDISYKISPSEVLYLEIIKWEVNQNDLNPHRGDMRKKVGNSWTNPRSEAQIGRMALLRSNSFSKTQGREIILNMNEEEKIIEQDDDEGDIGGED